MAVALYLDNKTFVINDGTARSTTFDAGLFSFTSSSIDGTITIFKADEIAFSYTANALNVTYRNEANVGTYTDVVAYLNGIQKESSTIDTSLPTDAATETTQLKNEALLNAINDKLKSGGQNFLIEVNKGVVLGHSLVHKFGWRGNVSVNHHHLWNDPTANTNMIFSTAPEDYNVITTGVDTAAGVGCRSVCIRYLDANWDEQEVTVATNGGTAAAGISANRILTACAKDNGTYGGSNVNLVTIQGVTTGNNYGFMEAGEGKTQNTQYCTPNGHTAFILNTSISLETNKAANLILHKREGADIVAAPFTSQNVVHQWDGVATPSNEKIEANHVMPEKTDVWVGADMTSGTGIVQFDYDILIVDNNYL